MVKKARWIYYRDDNGIKRCKCSECKTSYGCMDTPYCPNCGRKCVNSNDDKEKPDRSKLILWISQKIKRLYNG